jgi:Zn-dependent M28 family amino/carboxypeptidase
MLRRLGWKAGQRFYNGEDLELPDRNPPVSKTEENPAFATVITSDSIIRGMFGGETHSFDELELADTTGRPMPTFPLHSSIHLVLKPARVTEKHCRNVVGVIEGNDPALRSEFVAIGAHYDHLGKRNGEIYHGADDDGSGTVGVLEAARALARTRANKRSILIVFHAAEEKGLFGSEYLTSHLPGLECVDLQVNLDMIGRENPDSIYSIGSERLSSELRGMIEKVNDDGVKMRLNYSYDARNDPNRFYFRSDHYNYAKHGIPIVFFFDDMRADYHRPTDTIEKINFEKIRKVAALASGIIEEAANLNQKLRVDRNGE